MPHQKTTGANLWPPRFNICLRRFITVLTVNEDETQFAIFKAVCGFHRRQPNRMPTPSVDAKSTQSDRQAPVKCLRIANLLDVVGPPPAAGYKVLSQYDAGAATRLASMPDIGSELCQQLGAINLVQQLRPRMVLVEPIVLVPYITLTHPC